MIKINVTVKADYDRTALIDEIEKAYPIERGELSDINILRKSLKLAHGGAYYDLTLAVCLDEEREKGLLKMKKRVSEAPVYAFMPKKYPFGSRPVVVGAGPAGLFTALTLAEGGARPLILERGAPVEERARAVDTFFTSGRLDEVTNVQFGEGGAGAFSDGKLKVGGMDEYKHYVLKTFVECGAPEDIIYTVGAHLGTDKLPSIVASLRERIKSLGGEFIYYAKLSDVIIKGGRVSAAVYVKGGSEQTLPTERIYLCTGHSARDTFRMLYEKGIPMQSRGFGIGVRIEHPREYIDSLVYKDKTLAGTVGTASYHLVTHLPMGRSVYSFCMCPGGTVVAAASESGGIVTNGMSEYARHGDNSNAALLVSVTPEDFPSDSPLAGLELQRSIEERAFLSGGGNYYAPVSRLSGFMSGNAEAPSGVRPSYPVGHRVASPEEYLPNFITESLRAGIKDFDDWMPGFFYPDAVLTGAETRSTSPIRVLRSECGEALTAEGLYLIGEGAGYAGGIVSSAVDGVRIAEKSKEQK